MDAQCLIAECDRAVRTRGMCHAHYNRFLRTGEMPTSAVRSYGVGSCSVEGCGKPHHGLGLCDLHYTRQRDFGDVHRAKQMPSGPDHWNFAGDSIEYAGMHSRILALRGRAAEHACAHCDQPADNWAYDHADPDERVSKSPAHEGHPYSIDPAHYIALCTRCHVLFDQRQTVGERELLA